MIGRQNSKQNNIALICRFPPTQNSNLFNLGLITRGFDFVTRHLMAIGLSLVFGVIGYFYITIRLDLIRYNQIPIGVEMQPVDFLYIAMAIVGIVVIAIFVNRSYSTPSSGRVRITRSTSDSVDGFGVARAYDYSYSAAATFGYGTTLPVSLDQERVRTDTFREGAKDKSDDNEGKSKRKHSHRIE